MKWPDGIALPVTCAWHWACHSCDGVEHFLDNAFVTPAPLAIRNWFFDILGSLLLR
jgi:hypothetical protein